MGPWRDRQAGTPGAICRQTRRPPPPPPYTVSDTALDTASGRPTAPFLQAHRRQLEMWTLISTNPRHPRTLNTPLEEQSLSEPPLVNQQPRKLSRADPSAVTPKSRFFSKERTPSPSPLGPSHSCKIKRRCSCLSNFAQSVLENGTILLCLAERDNSGVARV